jgi:hypothetical protein
MVLDLFNRDVEDLIARGKYGRAAKILGDAVAGGARDPRTRLRLADVLIMENRGLEALPLLFELADEYASQGQAAKAIALIKKIQRLSPGHPDAEERLAALIKAGRRAPVPTVVSEVGFVSPGAMFSPEHFAAGPSPAPRPTASHIETLRSSTWTPSTRQDEGDPDPALGIWSPQAPPPPPLAAAPPPAVPQAEEIERFEVEEEPAIEVVPEPESALHESPLFSGFAEDELIAVIRGFRLKTFEAGDIVIIEGDTGNSLFVVTTGSVKAFVRNPAGGEPLLVRRMADGDFFGEISILSGKPRTATVTAATACELLELDRPTLEQITAAHPHVRQVLEDFYISRASTQEEAMKRSLEAKAARNAG